MSVIDIPDRSISAIFVQPSAVRCPWLSRPSIFRFGLRKFGSMTTVTGLPVGRPLSISLTASASESRTRRRRPPSCGEYPTSLLRVEALSQTIAKQCLVRRASIDWSARMQERQTSPTLSADSRIDARSPEARPLHALQGVAQLGPGSFCAARESFHDIGVLRGHVRLFPGIALEMEQ